MFSSAGRMWTSKFKGCQLLEGDQILAISTDFAYTQHSVARMRYLWRTGDLGGIISEDS